MHRVDTHAVRASPQVPAAGETKVLTDDGVFYEHERTIDVGAASPQTLLRLKLEIKVNDGVGDEALVRSPRAKDLIAIVTS